MADDEQKQSPDTPEPETPQEEAPEQQVPDADDQAPTAEPIPEDAQDEAPAEEEAPATDAPTEGAAPEPEAPEAPAPEAEQPAAEEPEPPAAAPPPGKKQKKPAGGPGAELDPISIESDQPDTAEQRARREAEEEERATREAAVLAEADEEGPVTTKVAKLSGDSRFLATGKRKSSVARVMLTSGSGAIQINERKLEEYFPRAYLQTVAKQPLVHSGYEGNVDVRVRVHGGGISGQAAAIRHGIARALCEIDPELRIELKRRGMLTRDARVKERRKAGLKKARKKPQFSKR
jgi:small subunit ribosomal protein S9